MMRLIKVLAGDFPKAPAAYNDSFIVFNRKTKIYLIDIESYSEESGGVIEIHLFDGRRLLIEQNEAFIKTLRTALFDEPQDLEVRRQNWIQRQTLASVGTKQQKGVKIKQNTPENGVGTKQKIPVKKVLWILFAVCVFFSLGRGCDGGSSSGGGSQASQSSTVSPESKIAAGILDFKYTQKDYPKLYQRWGKAGVAKINELLPQAALLVANESTCDRVEIVEVSDSKSKPRSQIVFFADCANGKRFYVSEADIKGQASVTAVQDKQVDEAAAINLCDAAIKRQLANPSTFSGHILDTGTSIGATGNIVVTRGFTAKNNAGMEIEYRARCVITDTDVEVSMAMK
ncbi:hypothetical protein [Eikenella sp. NML03-A-027]|uniref:hypothetical protein n=1 Tax=Eikenella sp. NML03-A-027 TaxID=1795828 RepID=UPI000AA10F3F|nr:hypothetical protein [Eikenella sp. NML03-A-027]